MAKRGESQLLGALNIILYSKNTGTEGTVSICVSSHIPLSEQLMADAAQVVLSTRDIARSSLVRCYNPSEGPIAQSGTNRICIIGRTPSRACGPRLLLCQVMSLKRRSGVTDHTYRRATGLE